MFTGCRQLIEGETKPEDITIDIDLTEKIIVSSPVWGDIYAPGESLQIKWITSFSSVSHVNIYLFRKSVLQRTIVYDLLNEGTYLWYIPDSIDNSVQYKLKIENSNNREIFNYSGRFGILNNN